MLSADQLRLGVGPNASANILTKTASAMRNYGAEFGLDQPHREVHFIAQLAHESAHFRTTTEYASGWAYEGRTDLGNTQKGDGPRFKGHGLIQLTGRFNHRSFSRWMQKRAPGSPDFEEQPKLVTQFPWAFLAAAYYWQDRKLNRFADTNNIEMISRRINGGMNGYSDRLDYYVKYGLIRLGYGPREVHKFQLAAGITADDIAGPQTRGAIHDTLVRLKAPQADNAATLPKIEIPPPPPDIEPAGEPEPEPNTIWNLIAALLRRFFYRS